MEAAGDPSETPAGNRDRAVRSNSASSAISPHTTPRRPFASPEQARKTPQLSPSPKFKEPSTHKRPPDNNPTNIHSKTTETTSLFLHMPAREPPTSPKPDPAPSQSEPRESYESPSSVLPRHSRGLDFARARTNLHHSTVPNQSTPGSSPIVSKGGGIDIPQRRGSIFSSINESPRGSFNSAWYNGQDRFFRPRSMGSVTALTSDASTSSSDEDDNASRMDEEEMLSTPQANKEMCLNAATPYGTREETITGGMVHNPSPMQRRFHPFRRTKPLRGAARTPRYRIPEARRNQEDTVAMDEGGEDVDMERMARRDSISTVTDKLKISRGNGNDSGDEGPFKFQSSGGVVRRPVTRRSNLLPKTKGFARIKAALFEESAPVDSESRREAEVIRQVRVSDLGTGQRGLMNTSMSSPDLTPTIPNVPMDASDMSDIDGLGLSHTTSASSETKKHRPPIERRASGFRDFWPRMPNNRATPPPPLHQPPFFFQRPRSSSGVSGISEDMRLDSPTTTNTPASRDQSFTPQRAPSDGDAPSFQLPNLPTAAEVSKKVSKRRRDEDWDPASIKRRAVSPGMSVQSSPVLGQSPVSNGGGWWGPAGQTQTQQPGRLNRESSSGSVANAPDDRSASMGSNGVNPPTPSLGPKRVGMQGMTDTNDGFTRMTIE